MYTVLAANWEIYCLKPNHGKTPILQMKTDIPEMLRPTPEVWPLFGGVQLETSAVCFLRILRSPATFQKMVTW